jgi:hypothetical protein
MALSDESSSPRQWMAINLKSMSSATLVPHFIFLVFFLIPHTESNIRYVPEVVQTTEVKHVESSAIKNIIFVFKFEGMISGK